MLITVNGGTCDRADGTKAGAAVGAGAAVLAGSAVLGRDGRRMARGYPPLSFGKRRPGDDFR